VHRLWPGRLLINIGPRRVGVVAGPLAGAEIGLGEGPRLQPRAGGLGDLCRLGRRAMPGRKWFKVHNRAVLPRRTRGRAELPLPLGARRLVQVPVVQEEGGLFGAQPDDDDDDDDDRDGTHHQRLQCVQPNLCSNP